LLNEAPVPTPTSTFGVAGEAWMKRSLAMPEVTVRSSAKTFSANAGSVPAGVRSPVAATVA
jgi:hypothetical protein